MTDEDHAMRRLGLAAVVALCAALGSVGNDPWLVALFVFTGVWGLLGAIRLVNERRAARRERTWWGKVGAP